MTVQLPAATYWSAVDADTGAGRAPKWELLGVGVIARSVSAWNEGVEIDGYLHEDDEVAGVEADALAMLAAVTAHRAFAAANETARR